MIVQYPIRNFGNFLGEIREWGSMGEGIIGSNDIHYEVPERLTRKGHDNDVLVFLNVYL